MKEKKNRIKKDLFNGIVCKEGNRQTAGITLIALVITIIVLLILAGISIAQLAGNGLFEKAKIAKEENEKSTATETMNLKITNVQISKYAKEQRMPTLKELADNFCEDNDFDKVIEKTEVGSLAKISNENPTAIIAKLKAYPYEFEINSSLQLASIDGVQVASNDTTEYVSKAQYESLLARVVALENNSNSQFVDVTNVIAQVANDSGWNGTSCNYTATQDCYIMGYIQLYNYGSVEIKINDVKVSQLYNTDTTWDAGMPINYLLKKDDNISFTVSGGNLKKINAYGIRY